MTRKELLEKFENIEKEVKEIKEFLSQEGIDTLASRKAHAPATRDLKEYTLEDLYESFGKRKHYAVRLKHALERRGIYTLEEFLSLSPGELLDLENIGYETLIRTKKALDKMGIAW